MSADLKSYYYATQYMCTPLSKFHHDIQPDNDFILFKQVYPVFKILPKINLALRSTFV